MNGELPNREFVLGEFDLYRILAHRVGAIRRALDDRADLVDVLLRETRQVLDSDMTREQCASALVTVMVCAARGDFADEATIQSAAASASTLWLASHSQFPHGWWLR